jgi:Ca2+-binding RTX toxin-like protein
MPIQSVDTENQIFFTDDVQTWIVAAGVNVAPSSSSSAVLSVSEFSTLVNRGTLAGRTGADFNQTANFGLIVNASEGIIAAANYGVVIDGQFGVVENHGEISGRRDGIQFNGAGGQLSNDGAIFGGDRALLLGASAAVVNAGSLHSTQLGVVLGGDASTLVTVVNSGSIVGTAASFRVLLDGMGLNLSNTGAVMGAVDLHNGGPSSILNSGSISGDVLFGPEADSFDGRNGLLTGLLSGGGGADTLTAGGGDDLIDGGASADRVRGMAGDDTITGGTGKDQLFGGRGDDTYVFTRTTESGPAAADRIHGWDAGDVIDVSAIDASTAAGFQHLGFGGLIAPGDPVASGKVQYYKQAGDTFVVADVNGDGTADFKVQIDGVFTLNAGDFAV